MLLIFQFLVFFILIPTIYIFVLAFDFLLIYKASTLQKRWRCLAGIIAGCLISVIIIILDQKYGPLVFHLPQTNDLNQIWPLSVISAIIGFGILIIIDLMVRSDAIPFVILFSSTGVISSAYFLITLTESKMTITMSVMGLLIGVVLYFMVFPTRVIEQLRTDYEHEE